MKVEERILTQGLDDGGSTNTVQGKAEAGDESKPARSGELHPNNTKFCRPERPAPTGLAALIGAADPSCFRARHFSPPFLLAGIIIDILGSVSASASLESQCISIVLRVYAIMAAPASAALHRSAG